MEPKINVHQTDLFDDLDSPQYKQFKEYHAANPQIYEFIRRYSLKAIEKGHKNLSIEFVVNIVRWETSIKAGDDEFSVNNNWKPWYSRMFMREFPQYEGFFRKRSSKADKSLPSKSVFS